MASSDEKKRVLLRTTADVLFNAVAQMEVCVNEYPRYINQLNALKKLSEALVSDARAVGYIGRKGVRG